MGHIIENLQNYIFQSRYLINFSHGFSAMESNQGQAVYVNTPKVFGSGSGVNEDSAVNYEEITIQEEGQNQYEKLK